MDQRMDEHACTSHGSTMGSLAGVEVGSSSRVDELDGDAGCERGERPSLEIAYIMKRTEISY